MNAGTSSGLGRNQRHTTAPAEGRRSYAAGYPEDGDLYLSRQLQVDPIDGAFVRDNDGRPIPVDGDDGLLVLWAEMEYLNIQEV